MSFLKTMFLMIRKAVGVTTVVDQAHDTPVGEDDRASAHKGTAVPRGAAVTESDYDDNIAVGNGTVVRAPSDATVADERDNTEDRSTPESGETAGPCDTAVETFTADPVIDTPVANKDTVVTKDVTANDSDGDADLEIVTSRAEEPERETLPTLHLGIDFGTSTMRVAIGREEGIAPIPLEIGLPGLASSEIARYTMPSVVAYQRSDSGIPIVYKVGEEASAIDPEDGRYFVVREIKRLLLAYHDKNSREQVNFPQEWDVKAGIIRVWDHRLPAEDVAKLIVTEGVNRSIAALRHLEYSDLANRSISFYAGIPASTVGEDRSTLLRILQDSGVPGITSRDIVEEPVLALIPHYLYRHFSKGERLLVCDIGGGTTDVAILRFEDSPDSELVSRVGLSHGRQFLGGSEIDDAVSKHILTKISEHNGCTSEEVQDLFFKDRVARHLLKKETIRIKEGLSHASELVVDDALSSFVGGNIPSIVVTQQDLKEIVKESGFVNEVKRCISETIYAMDVAENGGFQVFTDDHGGFEYLKRRSTEEIRQFADKVFLVGGTCESGVIREELSEYLSVDGSNLGDPDKVVFAQLATVLGAAERGMLKFSSSLRQPPFDVYLESGSGADTQFGKLYNAFDIVFEIAALSKDNLKSYTKAFKRAGRIPHSIVIEEHGEEKLRETIKFPKDFSASGECIFEMDIYGRCIVNFGVGRNTEQQVLDFDEFQTEIQRNLLRQAEAAALKKQEESKIRIKQYLDPRFDRDNNR